MHEMDNIKNKKYYENSKKSEVSEEKSVKWDGDKHIFSW